VTTLKHQLILEEQGVLVRKQTENLDAYDNFLRGSHTRPRTWDPMDFSSISRAFAFASFVELQKYST
jgi:hypothetical protein